MDKSNKTMDAYGLNESSNKRLLDELFNLSMFASMFEKPPFQQALDLAAAPIQLRRITVEESKERLRLMLEEMFSIYNLVALLWLCRKNNLNVDDRVLQTLHDVVRGAQFQNFGARYRQNHIDGVKKE